MIGEIIPVGEHYGRWLYVTALQEQTVHGHVWSSLYQRWSKTEVYYARDAIGKKKPFCRRPEPPTTGEKNDPVPQ